MPDDAPEPPSLMVVGGAIDGFDMKLKRGITVVIGSGRLAQLRIEHPEVEVAHVKVTWDDSGLTVADNQTRKGTWVNGEPVETAPLSDGDELTIGNAAMRFRVLRTAGSTASNTDRRLSK